MQMTYAELFLFVNNYRPIRVSKKTKTRKGYIYFNSKKAADEFIFGMKGYKICGVNIILGYHIPKGCSILNRYTPQPRIEVNRWEISDLFRRYLFVNKYKCKLFEEIKKDFPGIHYYVHSYYFKNGDAHVNNAVMIEGLDDSLSEERIKEFFKCEKYDREKKQMIFSDDTVAYHTRIKFDGKRVQGISNDKQRLSLIRVRKPVLLIFWTQDREKALQYKKCLIERVDKILSEWKEYHKEIDANALSLDFEKQMYLKKRMKQVHTKYMDRLNVSIITKLFNGIVKVSMGCFDKNDAKNLLKIFTNEIAMSKNLSSVCVLDSPKIRKRYSDIKYLEEKEFEYQVSIHFPTPNGFEKQNKTLVWLTGEQTSINKFLKEEMPLSSKIDI